METADNSVLTIVLSPIDTEKFKHNLLTIQAQLKILTVDNETLYRAPIKIYLDTTLDN